MEIIAAPKASKHFETPHESLADLDPDVAATLIAAAADVALVIDSDGVIRDVSFSNEDLLKEGGANWKGRRWEESVTPESRPKIQDLLREAGPQGPTRWRQVNHPSPEGPDLPVSYCAVRVGSDGRIVAIGRDLRSLASLQQRLADAQQAMEREYARIRGAETRYRILFQLAGEAILIVDASTSRITELNPAAGRLLGRDAKKLVGKSFPDLFLEENAQALQSLLAAVRVAGRVDDVHARLVEGRQPVLVSASLFRQEKFAYVLVRLSPLVGAGEGVSKPQSNIARIMESIPEGLVVTDPSGRILTANAAFLDLAQQGTEEQVRGEPLSRWLGRPSVDVEVLLANLREHGSVRHFSTIVRGQYGSIEEVEVAAVSVPAGEQPCLGFTVRGTGLRRSAGLDGDRAATLPRSAEQFTELVGRVALKDLVRETTDMIEKLCIEAALEMTQDNRASAAEMLGLSRQALYGKLRRYGLGDLED